MASGRVLSTPMAVESVGNLKRIIESGLTETLSSLTTQGDTLALPDVWDGSQADQFRGEWDTMKRSLDSAKTAVQALRDRADAINADIMRAGGNGG
jgi:uncharacterized protein YukE